MHVCVCDGARQCCCSPANDALIERKKKSRFYTERKRKKEGMREVETCRNVREISRTTQRGLLVLIQQKATKMQKLRGTAELEDVEGRGQRRGMTER